MTTILRTWLLFLALAGSFSTRSYASCRGFVAMVGEHFFNYPIIHTGDLTTATLKLATLHEQFSRLMWEGSTNPQVEEVADLLKGLPIFDRTAALRMVENKLFVERPEGIEILESSSTILPEKGTIVELGCGNGLACSFLAFERPDRNFILMDSSPFAVRAAAERMKWLREEQGRTDTTITNRARLESYELPPESADGFIANFVLMYLHDVAPAFKMVARSLKKGGIFVVHEPMFSSISRDPYRLMFEPLAEAVEAGGLFTEFDLAIKSAFWNGFAEFDDDRGDMFPRSSEKLTEVARELGLELMTEFISPNRAYYRLVFRKN